MRMKKIKQITSFVLAVSLAATFPSASMPVTQTTASAEDNENTVLVGDTSQNQALETPTDEILLNETDFAQDEEEEDVPIVLQEEDIVSGEQVLMIEELNDEEEETSENIELAEDTQAGKLTVTIGTTSTPTYSSDVYAWGETIKYQITVTNDGNVTITDITVTDELTENTGENAWTVDSLAPGESESFEAEYTVTEADLLVEAVKNSATATGTDSEGNDLTAVSSTTEDPTEDMNGHLSVTKTSDVVNDATVGLGDTITYTIIVTNDGNVTITDITVTDDKLPNWSETIDSLEPGDCEIFTVTYTVTEDDILAGKIVNTATATGKDPEGNDVDVVSDTVEVTTEDSNGELTVMNTASNGLTYGGHYYWIYTLGTDVGKGETAFEAAESYCESLGGHLATITSKEENAAVYNYLQSEDVDSAYFGYTDQETEGTWKWVNAEESTYTNWYSGEPNSENSSEDYAMFYYKYDSGEWNDGDFGGSTVNGGRSFICEWEDASGKGYIEDGQDISLMTYLAMSDVAYKNKLKNYVGKGTLSAEAILNLSLKDGIPKLICNTQIKEEDHHTWEEIYHQCLSTWQVKETYSESESGLWVVVFERPATNQIVIAFRGSQDILTEEGKKDWTDDIGIEMVNIFTEQMEGAVRYVKQKIKENPDSEITITGHSLGGGLAIVSANATNLTAYPFDSAPTVDVGYYQRWDIMGRAFNGVDLWTYSDHMNQYCPVGNLQLDRKAYTKHQNLGESNVLWTVTHDRYSIVQYENGKFSVSPVVSVQNWEETDIIKCNMNVGTGSLVLGSSTNNFLGALNFGVLKEVIYGGNGNDELRGYNGNDYLIGGNGDDVLDGGTANDTYIYFKGQGIDTIYDIGGNDTLKLCDFESGDQITYDYVTEKNFILVKNNGTTILKINKNRSSYFLNSFVVEIMDEDTILSSQKLQDWNAWQNIRCYQIKCPVSVEIYNESGEKVFTIEDKTEIAENTDFGNFYAAYNQESGEYEKYVEIPETSHVEIIGTSNGNMDVIVEEITEDGNDTTRCVMDVSVQKNERFTLDEECKTLSSKRGTVIMYDSQHEHSYAEEIVLTPTCTMVGKKRQKCTVCNQIKEGSETEIPVVAHNIKMDEAVSPTVWNEGKSAGNHCSVCGTVLEEQNVIAKLEAKVSLNVSGTIPAKLGQSFTVTASGLAAGDSIVSWTSSDTKIATVKNGKVTATKTKKMANKTATITVKTAAGATASFKVKTQTKNVTTSKITGVQKSISLQQGKSITLKPTKTPITSNYKFTYKSSNKKVATVSAKGVVKGKKAGTAKITIQSGKKKLVVTVKVQGAKTTAITNVKASLTLKKGKSTTLKPKLTPSNSSEKITYSSSNKKVATVNAKGKITAKKPGTATITVKSGSIKVTCKVTVVTK